MSEQTFHKALRIPGLFRALLVATYFFLLVTGYYLLKPLSRTLYITYLGSANLPYVWIATILVLSILIPLFHFKVRRFLPSQITAVLLISFLCLLALFRFIFSSPSHFSAFAFYVLVDVYSVLLVESFWSLANSSYGTKEGGKWYGIVASGGLFGGLTGGWAASFMIDKFQLSSFDLITLSLPVFICAFFLVRALVGFHLVRNDRPSEAGAALSGKEALRTLFESPRIRTLTILLCMAQLIEPLVEYQFMATVEREIGSLNERTQYVSEILAWVSGFGLAVNLIAMSLVHSLFGVVGGLLLQPLLIISASCVQLWSNTLQSAALLKIVDRGLAYSSGRASRELLFTELGVEIIYRAKAWIDVYGYRLFRIFGSLLVLVVTWQGMGNSNALVVGGVLVLSIIWILSVFSFRNREVGK